MIYAHPDLRIDLCTGLSVLAIAFYNSEVGHAAGQPAVIQTVSNNLLSVFFNVYGKTESEKRVYLVECISAYLKIASTVDVQSSFKSVVGILETSVMNGTCDQVEDPAIPPLSHTAFDLIIIMLPYLTKESLDALYQGLVSGPFLNQEKHAILQKSLQDAACIFYVPAWNRTIDGKERSAIRSFAFRRRLGSYNAWISPSQTAPVHANIAVPAECASRTCFHDCKRSNLVYEGN